MGGKNMRTGNGKGRSMGAGERGEEITLFPAWCSEIDTNTIKRVNLIPLWSIESENKTKTNLWSGTSRAPTLGGLMRSTRLWNYVPSESGKLSYWCMTLKWGDANFTWSTIMKPWEEGLGRRGRMLKRGCVSARNMKTHTSQPTWGLKGGLNTT